MQERIDLVVVEEEQKAGGLSLAVIISLVVHTAVIIWLYRSYQSAAPVAKAGPMLRYVELMQQNQQEFVEAPGPAIEKAPLHAPLSDANRKASMPEPTGLTPTKRPGDGGGLYVPQSQPAARQPQQAQAARQPQQGSPAHSGQTVASASQPTNISNDTFVYRQSTAPNATAASAPIDWRSAIRQVKGPIGGGDAPEVGGSSGGERGLAEQGPISFETSWYDWGPYAQSMVSRIRVNWYANMPQLIRTGIGGVVTIRFTIQRDGRITEVMIMKTSGHPPYDFAARKAIELSSPLQPLPADFPNANERVTAVFYYNTPLPGS
ncbi:MAG TPA: energy transducer TonB [Thermoanaerobaculia bacterium]|nr:energy transducer TonB [Thermoanaerobaculia bacterium]